MTDPFLPEQPGGTAGTDAVPAADVGVGAPGVSEGFGIEGEEPDVPEATTESGGDLEEVMPEQTAFRTPDPSVTRRPTA
jgi:hypothetical protein